uniref:Glycine-rich protein n=1 Tax=Picea glauca TaxID=3330 RepID=A0A101M0Y6_PICGL|nr:hypothetical protein ABT39_MTgene4263 [Picea glauca]
MVPSRIFPAFLLACIPLCLTVQSGETMDDRDSKNDYGWHEWILLYRENNIV